MESCRASVHILNAWAANSIDSGGGGDDEIVYAFGRDEAWSLATASERNFVRYTGCDERSKSCEV